MLSPQEYRADPCGSLSIPYWKAKRVAVPSHIKIVHDRDFDTALLLRYNDKKYFRLLHRLENIPERDVPERLEQLTPAQTGEIAELINRSYAHLHLQVTEEYVKGWTKAETHCPRLWIGAFRDEKLVGAILCDLDREIREASIEWLQVLPECRGRGIGAALVCKALEQVRGFADFATVSGETGNVTCPEQVYRRCGFSGADVWHILEKKPEYCEKGGAAQ